MTTPSSHKWTFTSRLRVRAFGWSSSTLVCQRIKEAVSEIQGVARLDPIHAAEGAILMMAKLWPVLQHVDSSSGALGNATSRAVDALIDVIVAAPAERKSRAKWLDRLWEAMEEHGVGHVDGLADRWGELCVSPDVAGQWADTLVPLARSCWDEKARTGVHRYFKGT